MAISTLGDVISKIQAQSTATVVFSVATSTANPGGWTDVLRNGVRIWSFLFNPVPSGADLSGPATDVDPNGSLIQLLDAAGRPVKAYTQLWINSLK